MNRISRVLWISAGTLFVVIGVVGIFVPLLPTTSFLLLAAFCYGRSSQRFLHWLLTNRWFGSYIRNYREGRGLPLREKVLTLVMLWLTIGVSAVYVASQWWLRLVLVGIAIGVTIHLLKIKTARPERERPEASHQISFSPASDLGSSFVDRSAE